MTETEAKTKWCPMVRAARWGATKAAIEENGEDGVLALVNGMPCNRFIIDESEHPEDHIYKETLCIGSACMMWREVFVPAVPSTDGSCAVGDMDGYCGLAGKP